LLGIVIVEEFCGAKLGKARVNKANAIEMATAHFLLSGTTHMTFSVSSVNVNEFLIPQS